MWYSFVVNLFRVLFWLTRHNVHATGWENLPAGAAILCPNHTSLRDPIYMAVAAGAGNRLRFMAKEELFKIWPVGPVIRSLGAYAVRRGHADLQAIRESLAILKEGGRILVFPEGTRVTPGRDVEAKAGAAMLASKSGAPLIPVYIHNARRFTGPVEVVFGRPVHVRGAREAAREATARLQDEVDAIRQALRRRGAGEQHAN